MTQATIQQTLDLAARHHHGGRLPQAEELYRQILARDPNHADALHFLGVVAHQTGRSDLAVDLICQSLAQKPDNPDAHNNLGNILRIKGQLDEAVAAFTKAISLRPNFPEAQNNLGNALRDQSNLHEAEAAYRQAIALRPNFPEGENNLGIVLRDLGRLDEAVAASQRAISLRADYAEAHFNLANALRDQGHLDDAIAAFRQAIVPRPKSPETHYNLGIALRDKGELDESIAASRQAIALRPEYAEAHFNLGNALRDKSNLSQANRIEDAIAAYRQAIALKPDYGQAHYNLALALLARGDFAVGWEEYEWRWKCKDFPSLQRNFPQPQWDGRSLDSATLLLHTEQGMGDAIQFFRYLPMVAGRVGKVIIECQSELRRLFQTSAPDCQIVTRGQRLPAFDYHCPLLSLPKLFRTVLETLPATVPYVRVDPALIDQWSQTLGPSGAKFRIGLAWAGNPGFKGDETRSLCLEQLAPLASVQNITFFSLQKGAAGEQAKNPPAGLKLVNLGPSLSDFGDTAAVMSSLDLIVTSDTSVPHLAGALARPVWVMLQAVPDFRWMLEPDETPWYPTMRLFRQPAPGDWESVIRRIVDCLPRAMKELRP